MKKFVARGVAVLSAVSATIVMGCSGIASADGIVGLTFDKAKEAFGENATVVVSTVVGDQLPTEKCLVTSWRRSNNGTGSILVHLNCNAPVATAGTSGRSAATPEGKQAKLDAKRAANVAKDPSICERSAETAEWCTLLCDRTEQCTYPAN